MAGAEDTRATALSRHYRVPTLPPHITCGNGPTPPPMEAVRSVVDVVVRHTLYHGRDGVCISGRAAAELLCVRIATTL